MLFIFVEGRDDKRFFESYYKPEKVIFVEYKTMSNKEIQAYINSFSRITTADYLFFADADGASIKDKLDKTAKKYPMCDKSKIRIVQREIESWYLAGLNQTICAKYKVKYIPRTDDVSKEKFNSMVPKGHNHTSFQVEILKHFDKECAKSRNYSFESFAS